MTSASGSIFIAASRTFWRRVPILVDLFSNLASESFVHLLYKIKNTRPRVILVKK
jgi:hypothetical protein